MQHKKDGNHRIASQFQRLMVVNRIKATEYSSLIPISVYKVRLSASPPAVFTLSRSSFVKKIMFPTPYNAFPFILFLSDGLTMCSNETES